MCSRYWFDKEAYDELEEMNIGLQPGKPVERYDIHPSDQAFVIGHNDAADRLVAVRERWGISSFDKKLVINARAETVFDRKMFRNGIQHHRVIIPAAGFYEWNAAKEKYSFRRKQGALYMAGIAENIGKENRFVILTTAPNESMKGVHNRMPLVLEKDQLKDWILDDSRTEEILRQVPANLERYTEYEQLSLFD